MFGGTLAFRPTPIISFSFSIWWFMRFCQVLSVGRRHFGSRIAMRQTIKTISNQTAQNNCGFFGGGIVFLLFLYFFGGGAFSWALQMF